MQQHSLFRVRAARTFITLLVALGALPSFGQSSIPLNFLFRPNSWAGYEHIGPAEIGNGTVALPSPYVGLTVPLYTSFTLGREPLKVKAHQIMGQFNGRYQRVIFRGTADSLLQNGELARQATTNIAGAAGFVGVKMSLNQGIWVYGLRTNLAFGKGALGKPNYSILAGLARAQLKGLHKGYLYGLGFYASKDLILPIPAFGYYYKPYREITFYIFFPVQMRLAYQATEHLNVAMVSTISTRPAVVDIRTDTETRPARFGSIGLRHGLLATIQPRKHTSIFVEGGFMLPQQIGMADKDNITYFAKPTWYVDFTFMKSFGNRLFDSPLGQF